MTVYEKLLRYLRAEKLRLEKVIESLEKLQPGSSPVADALPSRRGRKSMGPEERKEVSERMKKYWAARRKGNKSR